MEAVGSASESRDQFLQLLVTQLRHQDPLEPTKQEDFLAQLAQFSTLEGIEKLNQNLDDFLSSQLESQTSQNALLVDLQQFQNMASAANLVGKQVEFATAEGGQATGRVESVVRQENAVYLRVDENLVPVGQIREISSDSVPEPVGPALALRDARFA